MTDHNDKKAVPGGNFWFGIRKGRSRIHLWLWPLRLIIRSKPGQAIMIVIGPLQLEATFAWESFRFNLFGRGYYD